MTRQVESWNETPAANDFDIDEGGAPESHKRTKVNDSNRERMSAIASLYQDGLEWLDLLRDPTDRSISFPVAKATDTTIAITSGTNDLSALFNTGRRIKTTDGGVDTDEVEVLSVAYTNPTTTVTVYSADGDTVTDDIDGLLLHASTALKRFAFLDTIPSQYIVLNGLTNADFAVAIAQVVTDGGGTILLPVGTVALTGQHSIPINCRIIGQGIGISVLDSSSNTETSILDVASGLKVHFESFTLVGGPGAGAGTEHGILFHTGAVKDVRIKDVRSQEIEGDAIRFDGCTSVTEVVISGCAIGSPGGNGIYCDNDNTNVERCVIRDCTFQSFGGEIAGTSYGIRVAGQWEISNISISGLNLAGPAQQVGLALWEKVAANPNEQDAHHCSVSGISVTGTGAEARGIDMNGRFCSVTGANINLTGASSTGVRVGGTLGSQLAQNNKLSASSITAAVGYDETNTPATRNSVVGCSFQDCAIGIRLAAGGAHVTGCVIDGSTNEGILASATTTGAHISGNSVTNAGGDDYSNLAGAGAFFIDNAPLDQRVWIVKTGNQSVSASSSVAVSDFTDIAYPTGDGGPDGVKKYTVRIVFLYAQVTTQEFWIEIRSGPLGTVSDPKFWDVFPEANGSYGGLSGEYDITPDAGDTVTIGTRRIGGSVNTLYGEATRACTMSITRVRAA